MSFWQRPRSTLGGLPSVVEVPEEDEAPHNVYTPTEPNTTERLVLVEKRNPSDIFDADRTFQLGFPDSHTFLVWTKGSNKAHVLQDCAAEDWTDQRAKVAQIARANINLICTHFMFQDNNRIYVASEIADISLADIIPCAILIDEPQVSAILRQVIHLTTHVEYH
jgi:hypothetical protein